MAAFQTKIRPGFGRTAADPGIGRTAADPGTGRTATNPGICRTATDPGIWPRSSESRNRPGHAANPGIGQTATDPRIGRTAAIQESAEILGDFRREIDRRLNEFQNWLNQKPLCDDIEEKENCHARLLVRKIFGFLISFFRFFSFFQALIGFLISFARIFSFFQASR